MAYNVLIPLDGSRLAERSLAYVPALTRLGDLQVTLLSVVEEGKDDKRSGVAGLAERERNLLETYLREIAADMKRHLGIDVRHSVLEGPPADAILEQTRDTPPDLLLVATHGRSGISRWRFGSVADKLIRGALCPTLVVGPQAEDRETWLEADPSQAFKRALVPVDASELAEQALPLARRYAEAFGSELHLVNVVNLPAYSDSLGMSSPYSQQLIDSLIQAAEEYVVRAGRQVEAPGGVRRGVLTGAPAEALTRYMEDNGIDLVIMTSHGRGGLARAALGSVTDRLLGGPAPVLVVRPQGTC